MQIASNTTAMPAGLSVSVDKNGRDYCVVVVKGTFEVNAGSQPHLAQEQEPLVYADVHYADPATSSIRYECDFAPFKSGTDILLNACAHAPGGRPTTSVMVELAIAGLRKTLRVTGDRRWERGLGGFRPSNPVSFVAMPLIYERAFGGVDQSHANASRHAAEPRNPVGVGFRRNRSAVAGTPLPNVEDPRRPLDHWADTPSPQGFGSVGRAWQPRIAYAGTYDDAWLDRRYPFLPTDFDDRYFRCAPADQQMSFVRGGEPVRCRNMTPRGDWYFETPTIAVPVRFRFDSRTVQTAPKMDTLILEPDRNRFLAVWRCSVPIGRKLNALREVIVGESERNVPLRWRSGKPHFSSLADLDGWRRRESVENIGA